MKNVMKLLIVILAFTMTTKSYSQTRIGVKAGLNFANMLDKNNDETYSSDYKMKTGFHLGATVEFPLAKMVSLEPGILFSTKGFKYDKEGIKFTGNLNYLEIPINAVVKIDLGSAKLLVNAGPYLGYLLSAKYKSDDKIFGDNGDQTEETLSIGNDKETDDVKALDFGINVGAGAEMKGLTFGVQYGIGLANISPYTDNGTKVSNKVIGISVGYKFGGK
jgi:hypothetical protein